MTGQVITRFLIVCITAILAASMACAQQSPPQGRSAIDARILKIGMEILSISKCDLSTGKYNAELGVVIEYPDIDLPGEIDMDTFEDKILSRISKGKLREKFSGYYRADEKTHSYVLQDSVSDEDQKSAYRILKSTGYYASDIPFEILNGSIEKDEKSGKYKVERTELDPQDPSLIYYRVKAEITTSPDFRKFPFDTQDLSITLASSDSIADSVFASLDDYSMLPEQIDYELFQDKILRLVKPKDRDTVLEAYRPNPEKTLYELQDIKGEESEHIKKILNSLEFNTLISPTAAIIGWTIREGTPFIGRDSYQGEKFSTLIFPMTIERNRVASFIKTFVPLIFMMLISFLALFLDATNVLPNRLAILSGMLIACVMFHISCMSSIPQMGHYLNLTDKIFICSYGSIFFNVLLTVIVINQRDRKQEEKERKTTRLAKWLLPAVTLASYVIAIVTT